MPLWPKIKNKNLLLSDEWENDLDQIMGLLFLFMEDLL